LPWIAVTVLGLVLLWPVPLGHMPLSADHTVHLTRIWMYAQALADGAPRGWSPVWFFGTPVGDLYPVLGDLLVVVVHMLSFGALEWAQAYAIGFTIVFVSQGWAMLRLAKAAGGGPATGLAGAALVLCDVGAYREGGWIYTVEYGVWPQALATTFTWLALAELVLALDAKDASARARAVARGAVCIAAAMLAHPVTLPVVAIAAVVALAVYGAAGRRALAEVVVIGLAIVGLGLALSAWWVMPMTAERGWMVSYGWLWLPLERMIKAAVSGHLAQNVPVAITCAVAFGALVVAAVGSRGARLFVATGIVLWVWTSADTLWALRLDLVAPGSTQVQWQRFLVAAKPGLFFGAAYGGVALALAARKLFVARRRSLAIPLGLVAAAFAGWVARDQVQAMRTAKVGTPQIEREPGDETLDADYAALCEHLRGLWEESDRDWRITVTAPRNSHWFMDAPVTTEVPLYKQGFTPGDNFVHKPEAGTAELLDLLGVRYVVTRKRGGPRGATLVGTFGSLKLWERESWTSVPPAIVRGTAEVEVLEQRSDGARVRVRGSAPADLLVFTVAGYPRWELTKDGTSVDWFEVPAVGDGPIALQSERRLGELRGGKANGDDGTEPTLLAVGATDGTWELDYRRWRTRDIVSTIASILAALACVVLVRPWRRIDGSAALERVRERAAVHLRPWMLLALAGLAGAVAVQRLRTATASEAERAIGWVDDGRARTKNAAAGPLKTDMLVRPAVLLERRTKPAEVVFPGVELGERLTGWFALDDDAAKLQREGRHRVTIEANEGGEWTQLKAFPVPHEPGRQFLDVPTSAGQRVDLRVRIDSEGSSPPPIGFDLDLGAAQAKP
jgi:hypothetical protein